MDNIIIKGLCENNLKNISLEIPKRKITVFTGVSGSGKSSIVFDTIASESQRQMNDTYPSFIRSRLPKYIKPDVELIKNLSPSVIVDQNRMGSNARSTVGTASGLYSMLRLLFSRIGEPKVGSASSFSFNDPLGMCEKCAGMGKVMDIDIDLVIDYDKSLNEGAIRTSIMKVDSWYYKNYIKSGLFDENKKLKDYTKTEMEYLLYGDDKGSKSLLKGGGLYNILKKRYLTRDISNIQMEKSKEVVSEKLCPICRGKRLNRLALGCWINGYNISDMCDMELTDLREELNKIERKDIRELVDNINTSLTRMIDIGLGYLSLSRDTNSLSGGEAQRVKLVRYLGSSLSDMLYIFDEPSTGMHPRDVYRMNNLLINLRDMGNTVLVVEHDKDVIRIADNIVDIGPLAGVNGGEIMFTGTYKDLLKSDTFTGRELNKVIKVNEKPREIKEFISVKNANLHNLKNINCDIPLNVITVVTGVAGSGKSSLIEVFKSENIDKVVSIDQKPIMATNRSNPASYIGILEDIRKLLGSKNNVDDGYFSYNSLGACKRCKGKGHLVLELAYMDPIETICEECNGSRFNSEALTYKYNGKNILEILNLTVKEALAFFENEKINKKLKALDEVGLSYLTLGQPLSTLSGGERQRIKLAISLNKKGSIYILDEPTTGLHPKDIENLFELFNKLVNKGNTVVIIEHNLEIMKRADYIIDIGPDAGKNGGELVFKGTPKEMVDKGDTITSICLRASNEDRNFTEIESKKLLDIITSEKKEDEMGYLVNPIGRIESEYGEFKIVLCKEYIEGLRGLSGFSHLEILWWFDGCDNIKDRRILLNDKPYTNGPDVLGTFATRSPSRPNPIAVSICEVKDIDFENGIINLYHIDGLTGTPVLDIKPYTPSLDRVNDFKVPSWCSHWPKSYDESSEFDWEKEFNF